VAVYLVDLARIRATSTFLKFTVTSKNSNNTKKNSRHIHLEITTQTFSKMYNLNTTSSFHITSPAGTYVYDIVPVAAGLAAISSDDSLRLLDPLTLNAGPVNEIKKVNADVTCLKAVNAGGEGDAVVVCTAGRDGKVALWDPRSGAKVGEVRSGELHGTSSSQVEVCL